MTDSSDSPLMDTLATMNLTAIEGIKTLDAQTVMLIRLGALIAMDAPPMSYLVNLAASGEVGVTAEQAQDVLMVVAPIVGTPRVVSAVGKTTRALGLAIAFAEDDAAGD